MGFYTTWANSKIKKMNWVDIKLVKWSVFFFALLIAKLWSPLLSLDWYWYALIAILAAIKPTYKMLKK